MIGLGRVSSSVLPPLRLTTVQVSDNRSVVTCAELLFTAPFFVNSSCDIVIESILGLCTSEGRLAVLIVSHVLSAARSALTVRYLRQADAAPTLVRSRGCNRL